MMVLGTFLIAIANLIHTVIFIYTWVIIAGAFMSWISRDPNNKIVWLLYRLTAPAYELVKKTKIPTAFGGIDIAPIIILLVLQFLDLFLVRLILEIADQI